MNKNITPRVLMNQVKQGKRVPVPTEVSSCNVINRWNMYRLSSKIDDLWFSQRRMLFRLSDMLEAINE